MEQRLAIFFKFIKGLLIYSIKVKGLVLFSKAVKMLSNFAIVFNKVLIKIAKT